MSNTDQMVDEILKRVLQKADNLSAATPNQSESKGAEQIMANSCSLTEFIGTAKFGDTIGLVIANVDQQVLDAMKLTKKISFNRCCRCSYRCRPSHYGR